MVILHTSCVLDNSLSELCCWKNVWFRVTNDVYYELQVLRSAANPKFRANAEIILNQLCTGRALSYDLTDFYDNSSVHVSPDAVFAGNIVYAFYDPAAAEEFVKYTGSYRCSKSFLLLYDPYGNVRQIYVPQPLGYFDSSHFIRRPISVEGYENCLSNPVLCRNLFVVDPNENNRYRTISGTELSPLSGGTGGEAEVYLSRSLPDKVLKFYTTVRPTEEKIKKLEQLTRIGRRISMRNIAMPNELIYDEQNNCLGFTMPYLKGHSLRSIYLSEQWDIYDRDEIIRTLAGLMLELRIYQINISDLSANNILIGPNSEVYVIDCDSFETFKYTGGGVTPIYGHPDIRSALMFSRFREPHQINFSFAVLMFQLLLGWENPLTQMKLPSINPDWNTPGVKFPFDVNVNYNANQKKYERWSSLPINTQEAFADEFHFRKWRTLGAWVRDLNL